MRNPVWPSSCVIPAGTSNELDVQNKWEKKHKKNSRPSKLYGTVSHLRPMGLKKLGHQSIPLAARLPSCLRSRRRSSHLMIPPRVLAFEFYLSLCKFSTLTTHQTMVEMYLLILSGFPLDNREASTTIERTIRTERMSSALNTIRRMCESATTA